MKNAKVRLGERSRKTIGESMVESKVLKDLEETSTCEENPAKLKV